MKNYYALLGATSKATTKEIKKNYHRLATKFHPDKNDDPDAHEKFIAISEAYEILSNKKSRARYDLIRWQSMKKAQAAAADEYTVVAPPKVPLRTKRNRAQLKRALTYHKTKSTFKKNMLLIKEGFYISARYAFHIMGMSLFIVIFSSVLKETPAQFGKGLSFSIPNILLIAALMYVAYIWSKNILN